MGDKGLGAWAANLVLVSIFAVAGLVPYRWRVPLIGWITANVLAPLTGRHRIAIDNLALACPDLPPARTRRIARRAADNAGRTMIEMYAGAPFLRRARRAPMTGPGVEVLEAARQAGRPIIAISGHFGNYHVCRVAFSEAGHSVGSLYRPMANPYINRHYAAHLEALSKPNFVQSRRGMGGMIRHLRRGNMLALLSDQRDANGAPLRFFSHPALTPLSAAELALKYDALLIPAYGIRQENGLDFEVRLELPIAHSDPQTMMQDFLDGLEAMVRRHPEQWLWMHRRWLMEPVRPDSAG